jgi:hypothetical protein
MPSVDAGSVLFVDDQGWDSFDQMAAALRRRGVRTVRVTTVPPASLKQLLREPHLRWLADRLFYDERINLRAPEGLARLQDLLGRGEALDVVANEPALLQLGLETPLAKALTVRSLAFHGTAPEILLDKFTVSEALARNGMETPRQLLARDASPAEAGQQLGLPLFIKHPIGASGERVRTARALGEIAQHLDTLGGETAPLFYQEQVAGNVVIYGAVVGADGVVIEHGFRLGQPRSGPAAEAVLHDRPDLLAAGRKAIELFGPRGFVSFVFIEQADGRLVYLDANIRPWGSIAAPLSLGVNYAEAYAAVVRGTTPRRTPAQSQLATAPLPIFPQRVFAPAKAGRLREAMTGLTALFRTCLGPLGLGYCGYLFGRTLLLGARGLLAARRRAPAGVAAAGEPTPA